MPIPPNAVERPQPIAILLAPASPPPAAPRQRASTRPQTGQAVSPRIQELRQAATAPVRGPIGSVSTVGPNAARSGAPGILGLARQHGQLVEKLAQQAIRPPSHLGRVVDKRV